MFIGKLVTDVIEMRERGKPTEGGQFEINVSVPEFDIANSGDPRKFIFKEIATHLTQAILDTSVPREFWYFIFTPEMQTKLNAPEIVRMG